MKLILNLIEERGKSTLSKLTIEGDPDFFIFLIEDEGREEKIKKETRIWEGSYLIRPRLYGKHYNRYKEKFNHPYALEITGVEGFTDILLHPGLDHTHTWGCPLTNTSVKIVDGEFKGGNWKESEAAYRKLFDKVEPHLTSEREEVWIEVNRQMPEKEIVFEEVVKIVEVEVDPDWLIKIKKFFKTL